MKGLDMKATMEKVDVKCVLGVYNLRDASDKKEYRKVQVFLCSDNKQYVLLNGDWYSMDSFDVIL